MKTKGVKRKNGVNEDEEVKSAPKRAKLDSPSEITWEPVETLLIADYLSSPSSKIVSFDLDDTLIKTASGATFAKNKDDWKLWSEKVPAVLQDYAKKGYRVVIFTNQAGIGKGIVKKPDFQAKLTAIQKSLNVPLLVVAATEDDKYRKPNTGMWDYFTASLNGGKKVTMEESYFIGDAAGRAAGKGKKKDFSDTDLKFALNVGVKFQTPEEFFLGETGAPAQMVRGDFNPADLSSAGSIFKGETAEAKITKDTQEVVIFVGSPASGKSTFWQNYMSQYIRVNRDTLKTKEKCVAVLDKSLAEKKSCVVDNTNPEKEDRQLFIQVAKKHGTFAFTI